MVQPANFISLPRRPAWTPSSCMPLPPYPHPPDVGPVGSAWAVQILDLGADAFALALRGFSLGYYTDDGKLVYAGRVGTGMSQKVLEDLRLAAWIRSAARHRL